MKFLLLLLLLPTLALAADLDSCKDADLSVGFPSGGCELPEDETDKKTDILAQPTESSKLGSAQNLKTGDK